MINGSREGGKGMPLWEAEKRKFRKYAPLHTGKQLTIREKWKWRNWEMTLINVWDSSTFYWAKGWHSKCLPIEFAVITKELMQYLKTRITRNVQKETAGSNSDAISEKSQSATEKKTNANLQRRVKYVMKCIDDKQNQRLKSICRRRPWWEARIRASYIDQALIKRRERLKRWFRPIRRSASSSKQTAAMPPALSCEMSTRILPTKHLMTLTWKRRVKGGLRHEMRCVRTPQHSHM